MTIIILQSAKDETDNHHYRDTVLKLVDSNRIYSFVNYTKKTNLINIF